MQDSDKYAKHDVYDFEEGVPPYESMQVTEYGDYLCVQWSEHPVHVYKLIQPDEAIHPFTDRIEHNGRSYRLECIEDEKEHGTTR